MCPMYEGRYRTAVQKMGQFITGDEHHVDTAPAAGSDTDLAIGI